MRARFGIAACAAITVLALGAVAEGAELRSFRNNAGRLDASGWTAARSTEGRYTVSMPCLFEDYTALSKETQGASRLFVLRCDRSDGVRLFVARARFASAQHAAAQFQHVPGIWARHSLPFRRGTHHGLSFIQTASVNPTCAWLRALRAGADNVIMTMEAKPSSCADLSTTAQRFFDSARFEAVN